ncbi:MAG: ABC transporter permease subunit [Proteobacteria bacterium]|nr:ABC transporter permease subunit [Pseudomonadota bacterium]
MTNWTDRSGACAAGLCGVRELPLCEPFLIFYATQIAGLEAPVFAIALVSVCLIATAYLAEIGRAGLDSVHPNQCDSAAVCNFSAWQTLRLVVIPQAWKVILPPAFGFFLLFIKDSALASQIGLLELTYAGRNLNNRGFMPLRRHCPRIGAEDGIPVPRGDHRGAGPGVGQRRARRHSRARR